MAAELTDTTTVPADVTLLVLFCTIKINGAGLPYTGKSLHTMHNNFQACINYFFNLLIAENCAF